MTIFIAWFVPLFFSALTGQASDLETITSRYQHWVLGDFPADLSSSFASDRHSRIVSNCRRSLAALKKLPSKTTLYNTLKRGADSQEVSFLVKYALPHLATAYHLPPAPTCPNQYYQNPEILVKLTRLFDHLHKRGFRKPMLMPWKAAEVKEVPANKGIITDFHLRTSGYALATFLMRKELAKAGQLDRTLETCREILSHDEKFGHPNALDQNADGIRIVVNFALPYSLAAQDTGRLHLLTRQLERSFIPESDASDILKPDGLGFHHRAAYPGGYAAFAYQQSALAAWILRDTRFAAPPSTIDQIATGLATLRLVSQKYDMPRILHGRLNPRPTLISIISAYAFLADLRHPRQREFQAILARLADAPFLASSRAADVFKEHRNEIPPGPGGISSLLRIITAGQKAGAEASPEGHWSFNYGPLAIHRRDDWMVSLKGHSRYLWAFERSLTDDRMDERLENVLGFHDSSASLFIFSKGDPVNAHDSGFRYGDGWDWSLVPGTTTRHIPAKTLVELDTRGRKFNRPFSHSSFVGGLSFKNRHGLFAMDYQEVSPDLRATPLKARKAFFFFDNLILCLTDQIRNGDGTWPVRTTLFQSAIEPSVSGKESSTFPVDQPTQLFDPQGNGYFIPAGQEVMHRRGLQNSLDHRGNSETSGHFASSWIEHGKSPMNASAEYVILVQPSAGELAALANDPDQHYRIHRRDKQAIVVESSQPGITAYVIEDPRCRLSVGPIHSTDAPVFVMTGKEGKNLRLSVCNPDLAWTKGEHYSYRKKQKGDSDPLKSAISRPVTLTLRGRWKLSHEHADFQIVEANENTTILKVACRDALTFETILTPQIDKK